MSGIWSSGPARATAFGYNPSASSSSSPLPAMDTTTSKGFFGHHHHHLSFTGRPTVSLPTSDARSTGFPHSRARSEPLPPMMMDVDADENGESRSTHRAVPRAHSEYVIRIPREGLEPSYRHDTQPRGENKYTHDHQERCVPLTLQPPQPPLRGVSPAATEIEEPESQDIIAGIIERGVKVRDFGYPSSVPSSSTPKPKLVLPTEMFDQYKALTEVDYRWTQPVRTYPISGKTLQRLMDIDWLSEEELRMRAHLMDMEALEDYRASCRARAAAGMEGYTGVISYGESTSGVGGPDTITGVYPWKPFRMMTRPTNDERRMMLDGKRGYWRMQDRMMGQMARWEERRQREAEEARAARKALEEFESRRVDGSASIKRAHAEEDDDVAGGTKRRRLSPAPEDSWPPYAAPAKQYPAPLQSYNPEIYPDAASIIEASSQSQPRNYLPPSADTEWPASQASQSQAVTRSDTPQLDENGDSANTGWSPGKQKLVHPRKNGMKRGLSRTQTFAQL